MASRDATVRVVLTGDAAGATKAFRQMASEAKAAATITSAQAKQIVRSLDEVDRKAAGLNRTKVGDALRSTASGRIDQFAGGGAAGSLLGGLGGSEALLGKVSTGAVAATAGVAALGAAAVVAANASINSFQSMGSSVQQFSELTGKTAEEASGFALALQEVGLGTEQWNDRVRQFQTNMAQFEHRIKEAGVAVVRMADGTVDTSETMLNALQKIHDTPSILEKQRIGFQLFGESWTQLQPVIRDIEGFNERRAELKGAFSQEDIDRMNEFNLAVARLKTEVGLAGAQVGGALVPALTDLAESAGGADRAVGIAGALIGDLAEKSTWAARQVLNAAGALDELSGAEKRSAQVNTRDAMIQKGRAAMVAADATRNLAAATDDYGASLSISMARQQRSAAIVGDLSGKRETLASATSSLAQAEADGARSIAAAESSAASSIRSAQESVADAHQSAARSIESAQERVADAVESRGDAVDDLAKAEVDAQKTIAKVNEDAAKRITDAQERVADAKEQAARASRDNGRRVVDAEQAVRDALNSALESDNPFEAGRQREEAYESLGRVREDVAEAELDAARSVAEAEAELRDATVEVAARRAEAEEQAAETITAAKARVWEANKVVAQSERDLAVTSTEANAQVASAERGLQETTAQANAQRAEAAHGAAASIWAARMVEVEAARLVEEAERRLARSRMETMNTLAALQRVWNAQDPSNSLTRVTSRLPSIPVHHEGGIFQAPGGARQGLALLESGEGVVSREQMAGGGGGGVVNNFYGAVIDGEKVVEFLERQRRNGYGSS